MAAGKWKTYDPMTEWLGNGTLDMDNPALALTMALFLSTSNANTLSVGTGLYGDLTNEHANANGYTTGGIALTGITWTRSGNVSKLDCNDVVWTASGGSIVARYPVIYCNATVNGIVKPLVAVCVADTTPADVTATSGNTWSVIIDAGGVLTVTGASTD